MWLVSKIQLKKKSPQNSAYWMTNLLQNDKVDGVTNLLQNDKVDGATASNTTPVGHKGIVH